MGPTVDDRFPGSLLIDEEKNQKITTKFNGQADSVTLVAIRAAVCWHVEPDPGITDATSAPAGASRRLGLPLIWGVRRYLENRIYHVSN